VKAKASPSKRMSFMGAKNNTLATAKSYHLR
jgi:hypothetical protein